MAFMNSIKYSPGTIRIGFASIQTIFSTIFHSQIYVGWVCTTTRNKALSNLNSWNKEISRTLRLNNNPLFVLPNIPVLHWYRNYKCHPILSTPKIECRTLVIRQMWTIYNWKCLGSASNILHGTLWLSSPLVFLLYILQVSSKSELLQKLQ